MAETYDHYRRQRHGDWEPENDPARFDSDPLAELARLIDEDPFADMARPKPMQPPVAQPSPAVSRETQPLETATGGSAIPVRGQEAAAQDAAVDDIGDFLIKELESAFDDEAFSKADEWQEPAAMADEPAGAPAPAAPAAAPADPVPVLQASSQASPQASPDVERLLADISAAHAAPIAQHEEDGVEEPGHAGDAGFLWYDDAVATDAADRMAGDPGEDSGAVFEAPAPSVHASVPDAREPASPVRPSPEVAETLAAPADPYAALAQRPLRADDRSPAERGRQPAAAYGSAEPAPSAPEADEGAYDNLMEQDIDFSEYDPSFDDSGHMQPLSEAEAASFGSHSGTAGAGRRRGVVMVGALLGLLVLGGAGVTAYNGIFNGTTGAPPTLAAQDGPVKTQPADPGGVEIPNQNKLVYDRLGGNENAPVERIVPRQEDIGETVGDGIRVVGTHIAPRGGANGAAERVAASQVPSAPGSAIGETASGGAEPMALAPAPDQPKRVKTVVVKPDGTLVGQPQAPVTPTTPAPPDALARLAEAPAAPTPASAQAPAPAPAAAAPQARPEATSQPAPANVPTGRPLSLTPSGINTAPAPTRVASAPVQTASVPVATAPAPAGSYVVQVASRKSEDLARSAADSIQSRYSSALGGNVPRIERADLGDKGVFYRVGIGPLSSQQQASAICERLKSAGQDCFIRRN